MAEIVASFVPQVMLTVAVGADGSFMAIANRMSATGESMQAVEHGETKEELIEWLDRQVEQPTRQ